MRFNDTIITQETILATRKHFSDNCMQCILSAVEYDSIPREELPEGKFFVNDLLGYMIEQNERIGAFNAGECDHTFTFMQRAYWIQTGEMIALLP